MDKVINWKPDLVIVEFGMNDHSIENPLDEGQMNLFYSDMKNIIQKLQKNDIDVVVVGFFKQNPNWNKENSEATDRYNELLKKAARECNAYFADIQTLFDKVGAKKNLYEDITVDYMHHPTDWGHKLYLSVLLPVFNIDGEMDPRELKDYIS